MAVFAWGLQYKLSLYPGEVAVPHRVPMAKLINNDKQQGAAQAAMGQYLPDSGPQWTTALRITSCLAFILAAMLLTVVSRCSAVAAWLSSAFPPILRGPASLFFRPPPSSVPELIFAQ